MGCLQSKTNKNKQKSNKQPKFSLGDSNNKWKRLLEQKTLQPLIISQINSTVYHPAFDSIDKDVTRTFPDEKFFLDTGNIELFKQVLKCFALTFPKVGYTQGLNFLCGYFLLNKMQKKQSLSILCNVVIHPSLMCLGLYEDGFPLAELYCQLFWRILKKLDIELYVCLKEIGVADHMWIFQWYLTFFLYSFPREYIGHYFSQLFEHKELHMVRISLGIVLCMKQDILQLQEKDDVCFLEYLENLKTLQRCMKMVDLHTSIEKAKAIDQFLVEQCTQQIKSSGDFSTNFYFQYFYSGPDRQNLYEKFIGEIKSTKVELQQSKHDSKLLESYKRNRTTVQILDEILMQSIKKQINKRCKSSLFENRKNTYLQSQPRKWKSLSNINEEPEEEPEGETTVSIVRKVDIPQDNQQ